MIITLPKLVHFGLYDASSVHKNKPVTPNRRVSLYEIEFIIEDGGYSYIDDNVFKIKKNCVIVAKPGSIRHTELPFKALYIHLIADDEKTATMLNNTPDFFEPENPQEYKTLIEALITIATDNTSEDNFDVLSKLFALFSLLTHSSLLRKTLPNSAKCNISAIKEAINFMDKNLHKKLTLQDISTHVHFSRIYFRNAFIAATGISPNKYLLNRRLAAAKKLLLTTEKSTAQIAFECGFSSQSYMNYVFKQTEGCSPVKYKRDNLSIYKS